ASGNLNQIVEVFNAVPAGFLVFSGDDAVTLPIISLGGAGIVSVVSNEIPREMAEMTRAALNNDWETARRLHRKYLPLMQANFLESNPIPVKAALAMMGKIREVYRLPLVRMKEETRAKLEKTLVSVGLEVKAAEPVPPRRPRQAAAMEAAVSEQLPVVAQTVSQVETAVSAGDNGSGGGPAPAPVETTVEASAGQSAPVAEPSETDAGAAVRKETAAISAAVAEESPTPEQPVVQAAPEPVTFFLYESWQAGPHKLVLHRSTCGTCRNGSGHPSGSDEAHSRWHGPYTTVQEARDTSRSMSNILIRSECKCVAKSGS
ncbi:MAG: dihydrodipicolinate synthase family protein, partial [Chlamydiota bacterium]